MTAKSLEAQPVRVLHLMQDVHSGGVERTHLSIIKGLKSPAWEHAVICTRALGPVAEGYRGLGVPILETGPVRSVLDPRRYRLAARFARAWRPHLIHGSINEGYILGAALKAWTRVPFIMEETSEPTGRRWTGHLLTRLSAAFADQVFGVSQAVGRYLTDDILVPERKVSVIENGVERPTAPSPAHIADLRAELGLGPNDLVVGSVGRMVDAYKGFSDLIQSLALLRDLPIRLVLVGDGPDLCTLRALAAERGEADRVRFVGFADPGPYYALMNVFVLPSRSEAFGMVIAEAMRAGLPVVGTRVGGIPSVVAEGETGLLVPPRDPTALATALRCLVQDAQQRDQMGAAGQERADRLFSAERYVADVRGLYERVLGFPLPPLT